jgi:hypothetical protein
LSSCPVLVVLHLCPVWGDLSDRLGQTDLAYSSCPVPVVMLRLSCTRTLVLSCRRCLICPVQADQTKLTYQAGLARLSCTICPFSVSYPYCPIIGNCPVTLVLSRLYTPRCPVLAVLSRLSCTGGPVPAILSRLSCSGFHVPDFLSQLPFQAVLPQHTRVFCLHCPVLAIIFLIVLSYQL